jgi:putative phage-type endonuclease
MTLHGPQWLDERRKGIGGSDVAAILGLSPWKTAFQVYQDKRGEVGNYEGSAAMDWGKRMEPAIRQWYSDQTGRSVRVPEKIIYNSEYPFMLASLDGFTDDGRIVEIKTARSGKGWGEPGTAEIPDCYALQVQHYMLVTGMWVADVAVSIGGGSPELYTVEADRELFNLLIEAEAAFWERVQSGNPPEPVTYADAVARYGRSHAQGVKLASQDVLTAVQYLHAVREEIGLLEAKEEEIKGDLIRYLGDEASDLVDADGSLLATYRIGNGRKSVDVKALERDRPDIYQQFLKQADPQRRFLLKGGSKNV